jgi:hypothetical protein
MRIVGGIGRSDSRRFSLRTSLSPSTMSNSCFCSLSDTSASSPKRSALAYARRRRAHGGAWSRVHAASRGSASAHVRGCGCQARPSPWRRARASLTLLGLAVTACGLSPTPIAATTGCALEWTRLSRSHSRAVRLAVICRNLASRQARGCSRPPHGTALGR